MTRTGPSRRLFIALHLLLAVGLAFSLSGSPLVAQQRGASVTPTAMPTTEPTPTASPTPTGEPTPTVTPTPTGEPTPTASPTPTGEPTPTTSPTPTGEPTPTASPTATMPPPPPTATPTPTPSVPILSCEGFDRPLRDFAIVVRGRNRVIPAKAKLVDQNGFEQTDSDLVYPPVIQVMYLGSNLTNIGPSIEADSVLGPENEGELLHKGAAANQTRASSGNQFRYRGRKWRFNLSTAPYQAPGLYGITIVSGNENWYVIDPACYGSFVRP